MSSLNLLLAIRSSGRRQFEVAQAARIREGRLSEIVCRGGARPAEREALSRVLSLPDTFLFDPTAVAGIQLPPGTLSSGPSRSRRRRSQATSTPKPEEKGRHHV